ncbi:MAG: RsiG family protein [Candidatus Aquicultor sp.]
MDKNNELDLNNALLDIASKPDEELRQILDQLCDEEERVSYRRRVLHGKIDILRAELVGRLKKRREDGGDVISGADVDRLSQILARGLTTVSKVDVSDEDVF